MKAAFTLPNFFVFQSFALWMSLGFFYDYERNNLRILKRILLLSPLCRRKIMVSCLEWNSRTFAFLPPFRAMEEGGRRVTVASRTRSTTFDRECLLRAASIMERKSSLRGRERERESRNIKGDISPSRALFFCATLDKVTIPGSFARYARLIVARILGGNSSIVYRQVDGRNAK